MSATGWRRCHNTQRCIPCIDFRPTPTTTPTFYTQILHRRRLNDEDTNNLSTRKVRLPEDKVKNKTKYNSSTTYRSTKERPILGQGTWPERFRDKNPTGRTTVHHTESLSTDMSPTTEEEEESDQLTQTRKESQTFESKGIYPNTRYKRQ